MRRPGAALLALLALAALLAALPQLAGARHIRTTKAAAARAGGGGAAAAAAAAQADDGDFARAEDVRLEVSRDALSAVLRFVDEYGEEHVYEELRANNGGLASTEVFRSTAVGVEQTSPGATPVTASFSRVLPDGWVVATELAQGVVHAVRAHHGLQEYLLVQPFGMAANSLNATHRRILGSMAWDEHVLSRRGMADGSAHACGALRLDAEGVEAIKQVNRDPSLHVPLSSHAHPMELDDKHVVAASASGTSMTSTERTAKKQQDRDASGPRALAETQELYANPPKFWSGCYPGEDEIQFMKIGIVVDAGFVIAFNKSEELTLRAVEAIVASTNMIYHHQVHIQVEVAQILLVTEPLESDAANSSYMTYLEASPGGELGTFCAYDSNCKCSLTDDGSGTCAVADLLCGILQPLEAMTAFSFALETSASAASSRSAQTSHFDDGTLTSNGLSSQPHWHLLTACYEAPGVVGVAWALTPDEGQPRRGTICNSLGINVAVTSMHSHTWRTFAHELGHNFGMSHSFEDGQGQTGGLMDYDLPEYNGRIQFNERYRREELCEELTLIMDLDACPSDKFGPSNTVCEETTPYAVERLGTNISRGYYCMGGFCPTLDDGSADSCRPAPAALVFGDEPLNYTGSRIGKQLSGYGNPEEMTWRELNGTACESLTGSAVQFQSTDIVLVGRGDCTFDVKAAVLAETGAGGLVVFAENLGEDLVTMYGDNIDVNIKMAYISAEDGLRVQQAIRTSADPVLGYMGAAPPQVLSLLVQSAAPQNLAPVQSPDDDATSDINLVIVALASFGAVVALALLAMVVFWLRRNIRHPKRWKNANADFVQAYYHEGAGSLYVDKHIEAVDTPNVQTEGSRIRAATDL
ncbi:Hypothetical Protein FCC1311_062952 [Hondaea fermentalgiana]|uniref:PA domain-containing protein n=1 Tax=Hondaea fermentalgiana TaxID=2315210 RepID=A0A2R5GHL1_9STRA|nr:Hypothetical Protein FCC1311_062952 [Hondaea fermentalgiana]|eukprot:GBG30075.1 Hypothetical Protein FCC1311_062952 [Hondaea fermentalgiana]